MLVYQTHGATTDPPPASSPRPHPHDVNQLCTQYSPKLISTAVTGTDTPPLSSETVLTMVEAPLGAKQCLLARSQGDASVHFKWGYSRGWVSAARYIYFAMKLRSLVRYIYFTRCRRKHSCCLLFPPSAIAMIFVVMGNAGELRQHVRTLAGGHATPWPSPNCSNFRKFWAFRFKYILHIKSHLHIK